MFSPGFLKGIVGGGGRQGGGRNVRDYLAFVFIVGKEVKQERNLRARKKKHKKNEKERKRRKISGK